MEGRTYQSESEAQTLKIGQEIGLNLRTPRVILLEGCLGAGKTALTRGIVSGFFQQRLEENNVHSPTFSLVNQYESPEGTIIFHIDLYRLDSLSDQYSIGLEEILYEDAIVIIEWSDKLKIPVENAMTIRLSMETEDLRRIEICR